MYKFGLDFFPVCNPVRVTGETYFKESLDLAGIGEELGYVSVKTIEHHATLYGGYSPNPLLFLAAAAQRTKRMKLITGCVIPSFWNPVKLAAELSMADAICGGRLEVGFARGFLPHEFELFERGMGSERALRFREAIELIKRFWSNEFVTFDGEYYQIEQTRIYPPIRQPAPPIWIAATHTANSFKWAGSQGHGLLLVPYVSDLDALRDKLDIYREAYRAAGHGEPGPDKVMFTLHACLDEDTETAVERARLPLQRYLQAFIDTGLYKPDANQVFINTVISELKLLTYDRIIAENRALIGSPKQIGDMLAFYRDFFKASYFSLQFNFGDLDFQSARHSMTLFSRNFIEVASYH